MSSGYQEPAGGTASPSTGTAVGSKPIRAWLKVLRNVDIVAEPGYGSTFIPKVKTPFEILSTSLHIQNPAQTFYTNFESAVLVANQSIKVPIITTTESSALKDEVVLLKQAQALENKSIPTFIEYTETTAPANPAAGKLRIYANSTTHELTQRDSSGAEKKFSDGSGGGGGGAPSDAQYLTLGVNATLTGERVLTGSGRISITDAGPGVTATLDIPSGSIVDSYIGSHTSTKISITAKGQLNSAIVYNDQANSFGDFAQTFKDNQLKINNPADTFAYTIVGAAIGANRNLTLPLLTGNDTAVTEAFSQVLTNKTIDFSSNTGSNIGDSAIAAHTSTKITITTKGQLNNSIAYIDQANVFSDNDQSFRSARLRVANPANTFFYNFTAAAIAANRIINLPLLTATDTMAVLDFAQTFTNKSISGSTNTLTNIGDSAISSHTSTKITITAKGQLNSNILYGDQNNSFGAFYHDITEIAAPSNPGAGVLRIYANSTTHELTQRDSSGTERKFSDGSGGAGAPTNVPYLTLASDATLTAERVATASSRVTITDAGANSTATFDIGSGSIVDAYIGSHTSTKITITDKSHLPSDATYNATAQTLTNKTIVPTVNVMPFLSNYAYSLYIDGGAVKCKNNLTGVITSDTNLDPLITTILASGNANFEVAEGTYNLSAGFTGWTPPYWASMNASFHRNARIIVPSGYTGKVWKYIAAETNGITYANLEGGYYDEAAPRSNNWDCIVVQPSGTTTGGAVYSCHIRHIKIWRANRPLYINTADKGWSNQMFYEDIYAEGCKWVGAVMVHTGTYTENNTGMLNNLFVDVSGQAQVASVPNGYSNTVGGWSINHAKWNTFIHCNPWDLHLVDPTPTCILGAEAKNNLIIGGLMTQYYFDANNNGKLNQVLDGHIGMRGIQLELRGDTTWNNLLTLYRPSTQEFIDWGIQFDAQSDTGVRRQFARMYATQDENQNGNETGWLGFEYLLNGVNAKRGMWYNNGITFGTAGVEVRLNNSGISGSNKTFTFPNASGELAVINASQALTNKTFPSYYDVTETAAPANPAAGTLRIYANSTSHELTQRDSAGVEKKFSDGSGGGGITASSADTLTNKKISGLLLNYNAKTTNYTATRDDDYIPVDATSGNVTISLPTAVGVSGKVYTVRKTDSSANTVIVDPNLSETIAGAATFTLTRQHQQIEFYSDGANWMTTNRVIVNPTVDMDAATTWRFGSSLQASLVWQTNGILNLTGIGGIVGLIVDPDGTAGDGFQIWDSDYSHKYQIAADDISAAWKLRLPKITSDDYFVSRKTAVEIAGNPVYKRWGSYQPMAPSTVSGANVGNLEGILMAHVATGPGTCTNTWDTTEGLLANLVTTTTQNQNAGLVSPTGSIGMFRREQPAKLIYRGKIDTVAGGVARLYFGVSSANAIPVSDTPVANADSAVIVGFKSSATNYEIYTNDGSGAASTTTVTGTIAKNTSFHTIEMEWTASGNIIVTFDGTAQTISTDFPATTTNLFFHCTAQNATAAIRTHSIVGVWVEGP